MKPRLLDLFCGAGGAAVGYARAGFEVVGVDIVPQPRYPFEFVQADALEVLDRLTYGLSLVDGDLRWHLEDFTAIHASPPCQHYANVTRWKGNQADHPDLIGPTRTLLEATGAASYVIENVRTKALRADFLLCGSMFDLPIRRHRYFETNWSGLVMAQPCQHRATDMAFEHKQERAYADAMGCEWMTSHEAREAIPPAYTEYVGAHLLAHIRAEAAA